MQVTLNIISAKKRQISGVNRQNDVVIPSNYVALANDNTMSVHYKPLSVGNVSPAFKGNVISFCGNGSLPKIFVGAEMPPYDKVGGVATVMKDYNDFGEPMVIPYYNGKQEFDATTGKPTGKVSVLTDKQGNPIYTNMNQDEYSIDEILDPKNRGKKTWELELVKKGTMEWGDNPQAEIALYKVKGSKNHYMVYSDQSAKMPRPYATEAGEYHSGRARILEAQAKRAADSTTDLTKCGWQGTYTGQFAKAFVETWNVPGYENATVICSDAQMAYVPHWMQQKALAGDAQWVNAKPTYVAHNLGDGYTSIIKAKEMFVNLGATPADIVKMQNDPDYIKAFTIGGEENFFKKMVEHGLDATGEPCDVMLVAKLRKDGYVTAMTTVAELYGESVAKNPDISPGLQPILNELWEEGKFGGILNPLQDPSTNYDKPMGLPYYGNETTIKLKDGSTRTLPAFEVFSKNMTVEDVNEVKRKNAISLFSRMTDDVLETEFEKVAGKPGGKADLIGRIDKKWIRALENKEPVTIFCTWGRGDRQKGFDIALDAFMKFARTEKGKNAMFIAGGALGADKETEQAVLSRMQIINSDPHLKGRAVFIDGFAPGLPMASASHAAPLPSRWAPCELADLEAAKKFCVPMTPDTGGMKQKNFDPRITEEMLKATSYRTQSEYYMSIEELCEKSEEFRTAYNKLMEAERKKLSLRGVAADLIEDLAKKNIEATEKIQDLRKSCADSILVDEMFDCMNSFIDRPKETAEAMLENMKRLVTHGDGNNMFHPSGKSTWQMYEEIHFMSPRQNPKLNLAESLISFRSKATKAVAAAVENTATGVENSVKSSGMSKTTIGLIAAGVVAVGAGIAGYMKHKKDKATEEEQPTNDPSLVTR